MLKYKYIFFTAAAAAAAYLWSAVRDGDVAVGRDVTDAVNWVGRATVADDELTATQLDRLPRRHDVRRQLQLTQYLPRTDTTFVVIIHYYYYYYLAHQHKACRQLKTEQGMTAVGD